MGTESPLLCLAGALAIGIGIFLPWYEVTADLRGIGRGILSANSNGLSAPGVKIMLFLAVVVAVLAVMTLASKKRRFRTVLMALSALVVAAITIFDVVQATDYFIADANLGGGDLDMGLLVEQGIYSVSVMVGPWVVLAGSCLILLGVATRLRPGPQPLPVPPGPSPS